MVHVGLPGIGLAQRLGQHAALRARVAQTGDTVTLNYYASDGFPVVMGYDLRNELHTPSRSDYLEGATWGTGDGGNPANGPYDGTWWAGICKA